MSPNSSWAARGMVVAPHALAAQSGVTVLRDGGNALEAMVAAAATISVVYPHMNGIGGDSFWLVQEPGKDVVTIDACGRAAGRATVDFYRGQQLAAIPTRGPLAANTVAGTISGWALALDYSAKHWSGRVPLARLLEDAVHYAERGIVVTRSQAANTEAKLAELKDVPGFGTRFLVDGKVPAAGSLMRQPAIAATLRQLAKYGLADFYEGELARSIAGDLAELGSPLMLADFDGHAAELRAPVRLSHSLGTLYNMAPPTQGAVSLMILGILERLRLDRVAPDGADYVHLCVEATKQAFRVRDRHITDPAFMTIDPQQLLEPAALDRPRRRDRSRYRLAVGCAVESRRHRMDGRDRRRGARGQFHPEHLSRVRQRRGAEEQRHQLAKPRLQFFARCARAECFAAAAQPFHTLDPALAVLNRRPQRCLRHDGRRRPAADAGGGLHALCAVRTGHAAGDRGAPLAPGPHVGTGNRYAEGRSTLCSRCD